jgi:hypothetical protein
MKSPARWPGFVVAYLRELLIHHSMPGGFGRGCPIGKTMSGGRLGGCFLSLSSSSFFMMFIPLNERAPSTSASIAAASYEMEEVASCSQPQD